MTARKRKGARAPDGPVHDDSAKRDSGTDGVAPDNRDAGTEQKGSPAASVGQADRNEVALTGRLSAAPTERVLRSGSRLTAFRLIVRRPAIAATPASGGSGEDLPKAARRTTVDVVDCAVWDVNLASALAGIEPGDRIAVRGALRRRFASPGGRPMSWFTVEVAAVEPVGAEPYGSLPPDQAPVSS